MIKTIKNIVQRLQAEIAAQKASNKYEREFREFCKMYPDARSTMPKYI